MAIAGYNANGYPVDEHGNVVHADGSPIVAGQTVSLKGDQQGVGIIPGNGTTVQPTVLPATTIAEPNGGVTPPQPPRPQLYNRTGVAATQAANAPSPGMDMTQPGAMEQWYKDNANSFTSTYGAPVTKQAVDNYQANGAPKGGTAQADFYGSLQGMFDTANTNARNATTAAATSGANSTAAMQQGYMAALQSGNSALSAQQSGLAAIGAAGNSAAQGYSRTLSNASSVGNSTANMLGNQVNNVSQLNNTAAGVQQANMQAVIANMQKAVAQETQALNQAYANGNFSAQTLQMNIDRVNQSAQQSLDMQMKQLASTQDARNFAMFDATNQQHNLTAQGYAADATLAAAQDEARRFAASNQTDYLNQQVRLRADRDQAMGYYSDAYNSAGYAMDAAYIDANRHREDQRVAGIKAVEEQQRGIGKMLGQMDTATSAQSASQAYVRQQGQQAIQEQAAGIQKLAAQGQITAAEMNQALAKLNADAQRAYGQGAASLQDLFASRNQNLSREQANIDRLMAQRPELQNDMGLDAFYDNAQRRSIEGINQNLGARGAYGSSVADDQIKESIVNLNAEKSNREADYNLKRSAENRAWEEAIGGQTSSLSGHQLAYDQLGQATNSDLMKVMQGYSTAGAGLSGDIGKTRTAYDTAGMQATTDMGKLRGQFGAIDADMSNTLSDLYQGYSGIYGNMLGNLGNTRVGFANVDASMTNGLNSTRLGFANTRAGLADAQAKTGLGYSQTQSGLVNDAAVNNLNFQQLNSSVAGKRADTAGNFAQLGTQAQIAKGQLGAQYSNILSDATNNIAVNRLGYDTLQSRNYNDAATNRLGYDTLNVNAAHNVSDTMRGYDSINSNNANAYAENRLGFANASNTATNNLANSNFNFADLDARITNNANVNSLGFQELGERGRNNFTQNTISNNTQLANDRNNIASNQYKYDALGVDSAFRQGDLELGQSRLRNDATASIDRNTLANNQFGLDYMTGISNIAQGQDAGDLQRQIAQMNAANLAQNAARNRTNDGVDNQMKYGDAISGIIGKGNTLGNTLDVDLFGTGISAGVGVGSEIFGQATRNTNLTQQQQQAEDDRFAAAMKLFAASRG